MCGEERGAGRGPGWGVKPGPVSVRQRAGMVWGLAGVPHLVPGLEVSLRAVSRKELETASPAFPSLRRLPIGPAALLQGTRRDA